MVIIGVHWLAWRIVRSEADWKTVRTARTVGEQQEHEERPGFVGRRRPEGFARQRAGVQVEQQHEHLDQDLTAERGAVGPAEPPI